ncbi:Alpha/beta hydrolase family-domain-containing protein [Lipomyces oligophaga]|uniref:Alpha/beta hydrolase family-domain-containing protein n=1 Tax=Lipomyces oligophaga TaxID=45792 RepID=UPI0034CF4135
MSDLQKSMQKSKFATKESFREEDEDEVEETVQSPVRPIRLSGLDLPKGDKLLSTTDFSVPARVPRRSVYEPVDWSKYWETREEVPLVGEGSSYAMYYTKPDPNVQGEQSWIMFHHGAGSSALTFSLVARRIHELRPEVGVMAFDCRGHGETSNTGSDEEDLSLQTLAQDFLSAVAYVIRKHGPTTGRAEVVFVGHSLGGAVVAEGVDKLEQYWPGTAKEDLPVVSGLVVLDVVEGSAIEALASMKSYLDTRPERFRNMNEAIRWHLKTHTLRCQESALVSVPPLVCPSEKSGQGLEWRTDLRATERHWAGWFTGLSDKFLSARTSRMLILAGTDRLDKELTIGQMQGKYQLEVFGEAGHFLHEDAWERTALMLQAFWWRNRRGAIAAIAKLNATAVR